MKHIIKSSEPESLTNFKTNFQNLKYDDLNDGFVNVRVDIKKSCLEDQFFLCGYCCNRITLVDSHNEHIIPQNSEIGKTLTLDYNNIIASCESKNHCGHKKANKHISLTPLMKNCEVDIKYFLNGKMTHRNPNAQNTIKTLNLQDPGLVNKRKNIIDLMLFEYVDDLSNLTVEDNEYLKMVIDEINQPDENGKLEAFVPVIVNVINSYINN